MADNPPNINQLLAFPTLKAFLEMLQMPARAHIRLVKVDDEGLVEPVRQGNAYVMQPRVRIVATAFDHKSNEILRWQDKWDVGGGRLTTGQVSHIDPTGVRTRDQTIAAIESQGFQVSRGEWTPNSIHAALAGLQVS